MLDDSEYTARELDGLNEWFQLHDDLLPEEPFTFHIIKLKSGSPELVELVMDPLGALLGNGHYPALPGVTEESQITTTIIPARPGIEGEADVLPGRRGQHGQLRGPDGP